MLHNRSTLIKLTFKDQSLGNVLQGKVGEWQNTFLLRPINTEKVINYYVLQRKVSTQKHNFIDITLRDRKLWPIKENGVVRHYRHCRRCNGGVR